MRGWKRPLSRLRGGATASRPIRPRAAYAMVLESRRDAGELSSRPRVWNNGPMNCAPVTRSPRRCAKVGRFTASARRTPGPRCMRSPCQTPAGRGSAWPVEILGVSRGEVASLPLGCLMDVAASLLGDEKARPPENATSESMLWLFRLLIERLTFAMGAARPRFVATALIVAAAAIVDPLAATAQTCTITPCERQLWRCRFAGRRERQHERDLYTVMHRHAERQNCRLR